ncbi:MAG: FkbM family methyltransferase [Acetobacteraceae bacterium]|nr:FkbM family methyltransferase [Acetobacteraceae bacterium]
MAAFERAQPDLIFDLGMHRGDDARFYLAKGFRVMALEANPRFCAEARIGFAEAIAAGRLAIEEAALWHAGGTPIPFWLNQDKDDWSSAHRAWAEKGGHAAEEISVAAVTLPELLDRHGLPHYLKCDIEGMDEAFCGQLLADGRRPAFVSIEAVSLDALALLRACGYDRVQVVNQAFNPYVHPPDPPREGCFAPAQFHGHMSGLFGRELDPAGWRGFAEAAELYLDFRRLQARQGTLAHGWLDFHVTRSETLAGGH